MAVLFVDNVSGSDTAAGTSAAPVKTLARAQALWRAIPTSLDEDVEVRIRGAYDVTAPLPMTGLDTRAPGRFLKFLREPAAARPLFSAMTPVTDWSDDGARWSVVLPSGALPPAWVEYAGTQLRPAFYRHPTGLQRVVSWDEVNFRLTIPNDALLAANPGEGLFIRINIGWCVTMARIVSWTLSGPNAVLTLDPEASVLEFAKGTPGSVHAGLSKVDMDVGFGPFHVQARTVGEQFIPSGQAFKVYGSSNYATAPGDVAYDPVARRLVVAPPTGVTLAQFSAAARRPNGVTTIWSIDGAERVMFDEIDCKGLAWPAAAQNYVGYDQGFYYVYTSGNPNLPIPPGALLTWAFVQNPGVIEARNAPDIKVLRSRFYQIGHSAVRLGVGSPGAVVRACQGRDIDAQGIDINIDGEQPEQVSDARRLKNVDVLDNDFERIGLFYTGTGISVGSVINGRISRNRVKNTTAAAISTGRGSRFDNRPPANYPQWGLRVDRNDLDTALTEVTDDGVIYNSGTWTFEASVNTYPLVDFDPTARYVYNRIRNARNSGLDPQGGRSAAIYLDLRSTAQIVEFNDIADADFWFKSNCSAGNMWRNNSVAGSVILADGTYWSGYFRFVWNPATQLNDSLYYEGPLATTGSDNLIRWNGGTLSNGTLVTAFNTEVPFGTLAGMFRNGTGVDPSSGEGYTPASTYINNVANAAPVLAHYGPQVSILNYFAELPAL